MHAIAAKPHYRAQILHFGRRDVDDLADIQERPELKGVHLIRLVRALVALLAFAAPATAAPKIEITGPEETVYSWTGQRCEDEDIADLPTRAFRAADGTVNVPLAMGW